MSKLLTSHESLPDILLYADILLEAISYLRPIKEATVYPAVKKKSLYVVLEVVRDFKKKIELWVSHT